MFGSVRVIIMAVVFLGISGAGIYVMKLRSDNAILKANQVLLEQSIESQKQVIEKQKQDFNKILEANKKMNTLVNNLQKDIDALDKRFNKGARDFGKIAKEKPKLVEKLKWIIITSENADEVFKRMEEEGIDPVIFGLSDKDFQLLAKNFAQIRAHMMKLNIMIDEYKDYYESDVINNDKETKQDKK